MAAIVPFQGVLYDPAVVGDIRNVAAPPYDVIDEDTQQALHARHPNNVVRLELGMERQNDGPSNNRYTRAATLLRDWVASGVLRRDRQASLYLYTIEYRVPFHQPDTAPVRTLKGFVSLLELEELGGGIFPHEHTRSSAKEDRLKLLEACKANISPIFSLFSDPDGRVLDLLEKSVDVDRPRIEFYDDAAYRHRLWAVADSAVIREVAVAMKPKPLFIADGHHRYETALAYRAQRRQRDNVSGGGQPYDRVLMLFSCLEDRGLTILPTHRILTAPVPSLAEIRSALDGSFELEEMAFAEGTEAGARSRFLLRLRAEGQSSPVFGLALKGHPAYVLLRLRPDHPSLSRASVRDRLDVAILQNLVLPRLLRSKIDEEAMLYSKDDAEALDLVLRGSAQAAFLLNPPRVSDVQAVAAAGLRMPHKSTYFYPKPLTGLVMHVMEH